MSVIALPTPIILCQFDESHRNILVYGHSLWGILTSLHLRHVRFRVEFVAVLEAVADGVCQATSYSRLSTAADAHDEYDVYFYEKRLEGHSF